MRRSWSGCWRSPTARLGQTTPRTRFPEPPDDPVTRPGELWTLGNHRLLCGDATVLADMVFCDRPYGVNYANSPKDKLRGKHRPILNDNLGSGF
jgi:hypothetical protein